MAEFLTGCTHFGHKGILRKANRPFASIEEMDATLVANWNAVVGKDDTVFHLGDFSWPLDVNRDHYLSQLNGEIVCLNGNRDPQDWGQDLITLKRDGRQIVLFHYPIEEWNGWWRGTLHFHCHTHDTAFHTAARRGNVTVEAHDYAPIRLDWAIEELLKKSPNLPNDPI